MSIIKFVRNQAKELAELLEKVFLCNNFVKIAAPLSLVNIVYVDSFLPIVKKVSAKFILT